MSKYNFTPADVPETEGGGGNHGPLAPGWYAARALEAPLKSTRSEDGKGVNIKWSTQRGDQWIWDWVNVENPNPIATDIGRAQLKHICEAMNIRVMVDTDQLVGPVCDIKLGIEKDRDGNDRNKVLAYRATQGGQSSQYGTASAQRDGGPPPYNGPHPDDNDIPF